MAKADLPSADVLRQLFRYEPETGKIFYRERGPKWFKDGYRTAQGSADSWNGKHAGKEAFSFLTPNGYKRGYVMGRRYLAHVVIWALVHGAPPKGQIDHVNGVRHDNRIANLRCVTASGNAKNRKRRTDNTSGVTGVCRAGRKWQVNISGDVGEWRYLGRFKTLEEAVEVRRAAEVAGGFHPNHGKIRELR